MSGMEGLGGGCLKKKAETIGMKIDRVYRKDCLKGLAEVEAYDVYEDRQDAEAYLDWSRQWMGGVVRVLKPTGTFWLAIGDEYAAELKLIATRELGLTCRSWVIWYYTFGVHCKANFSRSHTHLFYFIKNPKDFIFNDESIRVPSARQLVYADKRANPKGRIPDNTWILRPQDAEGGFQPDHDTWYFPRVCGTFKEREGWHTCQMPEQLLGRIIRACSNEGDLVLDPFAGSGTTLAAAKKLGRRYLGFELSPDYVKRIEARLKGCRAGDPLDGVENPLASVPRTSQCVGRSRSRSDDDTPGLFGALGRRRKQAAG